MEKEKLSFLIIGAAIKVHKALGPGLLESSYQECLAFELRDIGLDVEIQKPIPLVYRDVHLSIGYRIDLLVEGRVVIELKSVESLNEIHQAQILTYMKLGNYPFGLLLNFNTLKLSDGINRYILKT